MTTEHSSPSRVGAYGHDGDSWKQNPITGASLDAFTRLRVASPLTLFDSKSVFDGQGLLFDDAETSGSGTGSSHDADTSSVTLSVGASTAGTRVRQSRRRMLYQPGKSQLTMMTFTMGSKANGITRRVGLFDGSNGIFLEQDSTGIRFVRRTSTSGSAVDNKVEQADWNQHTFDDLDLEQSQILVIDYEWLGVGRVRVGFVVAGRIRYVHAFDFANLSAGVYMTSPNLPVRWEIANSGAGAASTLEAICATVISEGGQERTSLSRAIDRGGSEFTLSAVDTLYPLIAIRLKSTALNTSGEIVGASIFSTTTGVFRWALLLDPTVSGTALSFSSVAADSIYEADVATTNATTLTGGTVLASGYGEASGVANLDVDISNDYRFGSLIDGTADIIVLAIEKVSGGGSETIYAAMQALEQV